MLSILRFLCVLGLLACFVCAAPAPASHLHKRGSFKVERVRNPRFTGHNGPRQLLKAHRKYGVRPPQGLLDALSQQQAARSNRHKGSKGGNKNGNGNANAGAAATATAAQPDNSAATAAAGTTTAGTNTSAAAAGTASGAAGTGSVANTPTAGDVEYLAPVTIGGQTLNLDFDTGSSDLWVFNTQLAAAQTSGQTLYDPTKSSSFALMRGASFFVSYGDGSQVAGNVGTDTVNIGGATVTQQAVELATAVSASFVQDTSSDGLIGLAFSTLNTVQPTQQKTFFDNVKADLAQPVFAADLRHDTPGTYTFGAVDTALAAGGVLTTVPVNTTQGFWQFASTQFAVGNASTPQTAGANLQAIADTGTTLLLANSAIATAYYAAVPGAQNNAQVGGFTVPCDAALPDLQLAVGADGAMATVRGADILFEQVQGNTCFGGLQSIDGDLMIFGDVFFKSNYVVFDAGNNTLSFAAHA